MKNRFKIIISGFLLVNMPVIILIILLLLIFLNLFDFSILLSGILTSLLSWFLWSKLLNIWILKMKNKGYTNKEIIQAGKLSLLFFKPPSSLLLISIYIGIFNIIF